MSNVKRGQYEVMESQAHPSSTGWLVRILVHKPASTSANRGARRTAARRYPGSCGTTLLREYAITESTTLYTIHVY